MSIFKENFSEKLLILDEIIMAWQNEDTDVIPSWASYLSSICTLFNTEQYCEKGSYLEAYPPFVRDSFSVILYQFYHLNEPLFARIFIPFTFKKKLIADKIFGPLFLSPYTSDLYQPHGKSIFSARDKHESAAHILFGSHEEPVPSRSILELESEDFKKLGIKDYLILFFKNCEILSFLDLSPQSLEILNNVLNAVFPLLQMILNIQNTVCRIRKHNSNQQFISGDFWRFAVYLRSVWLKDFCQICSIVQDGPDTLHSVAVHIENARTRAESAIPIDFSGKKDDYERAKSEQNRLKQMFKTIHANYPDFNLNLFTTFFRNYLYGIRRQIETFYSIIAASVLEDRFGRLGYAMRFSILSDGQLKAQSFYKNTIESGLITRAVDWILGKQYEAHTPLLPSQHIDTRLRTKAIKINPDQFFKIVIKSYTRIIYFFENELSMKIISDRSSLDSMLAQLNIRQKIRGKFIEDFQLLNISKRQKILFV